MALSRAAPGEKVRLPSPSTDLEARTVALVKTDAFEAAHLVLRAGDEIARHAVRGFATIHCLEGSVILETEGRIALAAGDWIYLERGQEHSLSANEDSALLVTILFE